MKTIKNLIVTVKYTVGYGNIEVSDEAYEQLMNNQEIDNINDENQSTAMEWLGENMKEEDAMDWSYEIDDIEEA